MIERRKFLKALACLPAAPVLLRGMSWAAPSQAELDAEITPERPRRTNVYTAEVPPGTIMPWAGEGAPPGYLPCDGRAVPQIAFQRLHSAIGDAYGVAPRRFRVKQFRVPDLRSRPAAALALDQQDIERGRAPGYLAFQYVIRT